MVGVLGFFILLVGLITWDGIGSFGFWAVDVGVLLALDSFLERPFWRPPSRHTEP